MDFALPCDAESARDDHSLLNPDSVNSRLNLAAIVFLFGAFANADGPVARWNFGQEEATPLVAHGGVMRDVPGPRPQEFPDFDPANTAAKFDGDGAHFSFADHGAGSIFDFGNGDAITIEAWVRTDDLRAGGNVYIIGKGRTLTPGFAADNQNWALRLREVSGQARVSFLFATARADAATKADANWHRWTTSAGFAPRTGWHHVAVGYRFGEATSVRGWIDGVLQPGAWDMGGPTADAPVVDDDAIWIGSSLGGKPANSFIGSIDAISIHREILRDETMRTHFRREGGPLASKPSLETEPDFGAIPPGRVLATFHEGMAAHNRWLSEGESVPKETARWLGGEFFLTRLPLRYDAWGIRESWKSPVLIRLAADVALAPGTHRFLVRARGLGRLWVNGSIIARTKPPSGSSDGHNPVTLVQPPPLPGLRPAGDEMREVICDAVIGADGKCRVIFETISGGKDTRVEPGELTVAVRTTDGQSYELLQPSIADAGSVPLTDAAIVAARARIETALNAHDDANRRAAAASQDVFWKMRHETARAWVAQHSAPSGPGKGGHPIDAFIDAKIERAVAESSKTPLDEARHFHNEVLPVLRENCFRCHGEKEKSGLRLNSRAAALKGGESGNPAIVPGDVKASALIARIRSGDEEERMPPKGERLKPEEIAVIGDWIKAGAVWPASPVAAEAVALPDLVDDSAFLRRVFFDTVGVPPSETDLREFLASDAPDKRARMTDRLLADERWADHWTSYWQDVLAENPNMLKPSLNNTGPFRWFLYESLRDGKSLDRMVTELVMLRGSERGGGSAGFGFAADNDAPFAAKGHIVASAFLGIELQCARCHDSPYHSTKQRDLFSLAAMFERKPVSVPKTSMVPAAFFEKNARQSLIKVTLKPGESVVPAWPFAAATGCGEDAALTPLMQNPDDPRERLAALITAPQNMRFAEVVVNRVWRRYMGAGFVEPPHDWEGHGSSHPDLMAWLAREFVTHDYDVKHLSLLILTSRAYQRAATGMNIKAEPELRFFNAPECRRLTAEQVVDSLYAASGQPLDVEEITFDPEGRSALSALTSLGIPRRAWMFATLSNERDRPSLSLPRAQAVTDVLEAFGWTGSRQNPRTDREADPNVLQPGVLGNSLVSVWITRASEGSELAKDRKSVV